MLFVYSLMSPFLCFILQVICLRLLRPKSVQKLTILLGGVATLMMTLLYILLSQKGILIFPDFQWLDVAYVILGSSLLNYCHFHFFNMSETARRIRILVDSYEAKRMGQKLAAGGNYEATEVVDNRMDRLVGIGAVTKKDNKYHAKPGPLLWAAVLLMAWRKLYYGNAEGF